MCMISTTTEFDSNKKFRHDTQRPFNIDYVKDGAPVVTRAGHKARVVCCDAKMAQFSLIGLITYKYDTGEDYESSRQYTKLGRFYTDEGKSEFDLFIAPYFHLFGKPVFHGDKIEVLIGGRWVEQLVNSNTGTLPTVYLRWPHTPKSVQQFQGVFNSGGTWVLGTVSFDSEIGCKEHYEHTPNFIKAMPTSVILK